MGIHANANAQKSHKTNCDDNMNKSRKNVVKVVKRTQTGWMVRCKNAIFELSLRFFRLFWHRFKWAFYYEHFRDHIIEQKTWNRLKHSSLQFPFINCRVRIHFDSFYGSSNTFSMHSEQWTMNNNNNINIISYDLIFDRFVFIVLHTLGFSCIITLWSRSEMNLPRLLPNIKSSNKN